MKSLKIKSVVFAGLAVLCSTTYADNWYTGVGFGNTSADLSEIEDLFDSLAGDVSLLNSIPGISASINIDDDDSGLKLFAGYKVHENFAIEFGYADLGEVKAGISLIDDGSFTGDPKTTIVSGKDGISGLFAAALGKLPVSDTVSLNGRIGLYLWDMESDYSVIDTTGILVNGTESSSDSGSDLFYGISLNINWFGLFYEVYDIDGDDVEFIGASLTFNLQ